MGIRKLTSKFKPNNSSSSPEPHTFESSRIIWVTPFRLLTKSIKIYDLTPFQLSLAQTEEETYHLARELAVKASTPTGSDCSPIWSINRTGLWKNRVVYEGDVPPSVGETDEQNGIVARWDAARWKMGRQIFHFPIHSSSESSPLKEKYPNHTITMVRRRTPVNRSETFVAESASYKWSWDFWWTGTRMSLFKTIGHGKQIQVARYRGQFPWAEVGGMLIIDEKEVQAVVAVMSCCGMLRKDLMRRERTKL